MYIPAAAETQLFSCLDTSDLARYSAVSSHTRESVSKYADLAFNFVRWMQGFMGPANAHLLHLLLRDTGAMISGPMAFRFFTREPVHDCCLDIYVDRYNASKIFEFFNASGYTFVPKQDQMRPVRDALAIANRDDIVMEDWEHNDKPVLGIFTFVRDENKLVNVVVATHSPFHAVISADSTNLMNFVTHCGAYSLYPRGTFAAKTGISFDFDIRGPSARYRRLGWDLRSAIEDHVFDEFGSEVTQSARYVGDRYTWVVIFAGYHGVPDPVLFNTWALSWTHVRMVHVHPFILRHLYVDPEHPTRRRVFATAPHMRAFSDSVARSNPSSFIRDTADILRAVVSSAPYMFKSMGAVAARFILDEENLNEAGVEQLALTSVASDFLLTDVTDEPCELDQVVTSWMRSAVSHFSM
ncbi:hypothetical protein GGF50DRAFT_121084 [Schizophyllum commune]